MPLGAQLVEFVSRVDACHCAGELGEHVVFALEHDSSWPIGVGNDAFTDLEPRRSQGVGGDRDLVLGTDTSGPSPTILYIHHECKGSRSQQPTQPPSYCD